MNAFEGSIFPVKNESIEKTGEQTENDPPRGQLGDELNIHKARKDN